MQAVLLAFAVLAQEPTALPLHVPDGWESAETDGGRVMSPRGLDEGKVHTVVELKLARKVGTLKGLIDAGKESLAAMEMGTFKPSGDPVRAKNAAGWEYDLLGGTIEKDGRALVAQIVALQKGADEGLMVLVADSVATCEKYADDWATMIRGLGGPKPTAAGFDVWRFPAPQGWTKSETAEYVALTRTDGAEFCQIALYKSRPKGSGYVEEEFAREWQAVLTPTLTPGAMTKLKERRLKSGVVAQGGAAPTRDKKDAPYYSALYVLVPYGRVSSVIVNTNTAASFAKYERAIAGFLDALTIDVGVIAREVAAQAGAPVKPEEIAGKWAWSKSGNFDPHYMGLHHGSSKGQYDLRKDGTYTFHLEAWGGSYRSDEYYVVDENGKYVIDGNKLTLSPEAGTSVVKNRAGDILKKGDASLEKTTYLWQMHYFEGIRDNELVLTPPGMTARDGLFAVNALFNRSYLLSAKYNPEWTKFGK